MGPDSPQPDEPTRPDRAGAGDLRIVGIGASSGGLQALQRFLSNVPEDNGMAFVVILHLSPEHESRAAELLQHVTAMPVMQVIAPITVEPGRVYVIPPSKFLSMVDHTLQPREPEGRRGQRAPIDLFFRTLAETHGPNAAAIVLSGSGADGSIGAQRIKEQGGVVLAQEPSEAEFDSMPRNAIATGLVDFVLPVAEMPARLIEYWRGAESLRLPPEDAPRPETESDTLREIFTMLRARTGHDFSQYKRATLLRRIGRRMQVNAVGDLASYLVVLSTRPEEIQALLRDLLISVTNFFRDSTTWLALETIVRRLFAGKEPGEQVRVWAAGCATGEEAYSVAMLLYEHALTIEQTPNIQIFATDIDEESIAIARQGLYPETIAADVSPERLQRFFMPEQGRYRIKKEIRDLVLFAPHNLLRDPPFSKLDLITCRNLLIYLNRDMQDQVLYLFHFTLRPDGYLLLGASESTDGVPGLFTPIDKIHRLYQRRTAPATLPAPMPAVPLIGTLRRPPILAGASDGDVRSFGKLHAQLLAEHTPPSVIINEEYEIVHLSRGVSRFLQFAEGEPSHNLLKVVHPDVRVELRTALFAVLQRGSGLESRRVRVELDSKAWLVNLVVQPIREPDWARGYILVIFNDVAEADDLERGGSRDAEPVVRQLEEELQRAKEQLRATIEQYETAVEEYKAANEELQAINEELRAATEELETSKEELQSVNEELITVNQELKHKVEEVGQSNNDLQNLMSSTEIGTIFVDRELRIKRYTPSAQAIFNLIPTDINRPLAHITHKLHYDRLIADAASVIETLAKVEREVPSHEGCWYLARLLPYRTIEDKIDGVIITVVDITISRRADEELRGLYRDLELERARQAMVLQQLPAGVIIAEAPSGKLIFGNAQVSRIWRHEYVEASSVAEYDRYQGYSLDGRALKSEEWPLARSIAAGEIVQNEEIAFARGDGTRGVMNVSSAPIRDQDGTIIVAVTTFVDITERKRAETELRHARDELEARVRDRTQELAEANQVLRSENAERRRAEAARGELLRQLVTAQEEERHRIARELHDQLGQQISALRLDLARLNESPTQKTIERLQRLAAQLDDDVDRLAIELRPSTLDDLGLHIALQQHVEEWSERNGVAAEFQATGMNDAPIPPAIEIVLYRVVQEALTNVLKHAQARHVSVILEQRASEVRAIVEDDGRGFDLETEPPSGASERRLGLLGIQERVALVGGSVTFESAIARGTTVYVRIPLPHAAPEEEATSA
ncbi:MAG: PAS domain-containing protein [Kouleothrix sp.]|nr:PAS domain-containing protein [Kouleothrix sp.]